MTNTIVEDLSNIDTTISPAQEQILLEPYTYIMQVPVSEVWDKIVTAMNYWLKVSPEKFKVIVENCQMFNNASLLLDDIQDDTDTRKGIPSAHCTFGLPNTLNAYYYASAVASARILELNNPKAVPIYKEQLMDACRARRMIIYWRDTVTCPSEQEYKQMLTRKSVPLLTITYRLLDLFSDFNKDLIKLCGLLGQYIHIQDDYDRLKSSTDPNSKSYAQDVERGLFTFPIIHAINSHPEEGEAIMEILRKRTNEIELKKYVLALLERFDSYNYTLTKLKEIKQEIIEEAKKMGKNPLLDEILKTSLK